MVQGNNGAVGGRLTGIRFGRPTIGDRVKRMLSPLGLSGVSTAAFARPAHYRQFHRTLVELGHPPARAWGLWQVRRTVCRGVFAMDDGALIMLVARQEKDATGALAEIVGAATLKGRAISNPGDVARACSNLGIQTSYGCYENVLTYTPVCGAAIVTLKGRRPCDRLNPEQWDLPQGPCWQVLPQRSGAVIKTAECKIIGDLRAQATYILIPDLAILATAAQSIRSELIQGNGQFTQFLPAVVEYFRWRPGRDTPADATQSGAAEGDDGYDAMLRWAMTQWMVEEGGITVETIDRLNIGGLFFARGARVGEVMALGCSPRKIKPEAMLAAVLSGGLDHRNGNGRGSYRIVSQQVLTPFAPPARKTPGRPLRFAATLRVA
ncbi:MAG: hypothetical protein HYV02_01510 [Deltaproteobacteria bacterium]|nr:hypothetical protein [Deltaproteobacteria bacterium]